MATRLAVQSGREALYEHLKVSCLDGSLVPGSMLPTVRELSERHGVTQHAVFQVIQRLTDEGVLYTVPRVGAFVGQPKREALEPYLMVLPPNDGNSQHYLVQAQLGFEDRVTQLGGSSIVLTPAEVRAHRENNTLPPLAGVFESLESWIYGGRLFEGAEVPSALFGNLEETNRNTDCLSFDDMGGGTLATRHLWQNGHRRIAFLALHGESDPGLLSWSLLREIGWRKVLEQAGGESEGLAFHPAATPGLTQAEQLRAAREAAAGIVGRGDVTAVVVANALGAEGMFQVFHEAGWPMEKWPAVVCFDTMPGTYSSVVSYLRLPWEDLGREVAQILWERRTGRLTGEAVQRLVPMRLITRLSCRSDWTVSSGLASSRFSGMGAYVQPAPSSVGVGEV